MPESQVFYTYKGRKVNTRHVYNLNRLAEIITHDRFTDKEKMESIFKWVAVNVDYDYRKGYSAPGITNMDIPKLLKRKRGVSLQYAKLLDTLCALSGIKSKIIYGYAKNELFDVNDSLYVDNHVWNAVKLDNQWYLLDVAAASGTPFYRYTRFSSHVVKLTQKYAIRYKAIEIKQNRSLFFKYDCLKEDSMTDASNPIRYVPVVANKLLYGLLTKFKLKVVRDYVKEYNPEYFLVQPELFAVIRHPDNPLWLLTSGVSKIRQFETDSAFYHFNDSTLGSQPVSGRQCFECDNEQSFELEMYYSDFWQKSKNFNKRNRFILALCEYNLAGIKFQEGQKAEDSLTKVTLLDTSLALYNYALRDIATAQVNVKTDHQLQKNKNSKKLNVLTDENLNYYSLLKQQINKCYIETENIRDLRSRIHIFAKLFYRRNLVIRDLISGEEIAQSPLPAKASVENLLLKEKQLTRTVDSLTQLIETNRAAFDTKLDPLAQLVLKKAGWYDSLLTTLKKSTELRRMMQDNYKKNIVEIRTKYRLLENQNSQNLDSLLYNPAAKLLFNGNEVLRLMNERFSAHLELHKVRRQLVKFNVIKPLALNDYRSLIRKENYSNFCWTRGGTGKLKQLFYGFDLLSQKLGFLQRELKTEIDVEGRRYRFIERELYKRTIKLELVLRNNRTILHKDAKKARKYKRDYLKTLRLARQEERNRNKN